ncbi:FAD-binding protein [Streptomyces sp. NPDC102437]|uniref:FAD-binding protein n=1 Tax=Streptomyces sp. NPDC102437 TaxID=3366175 RepID=UPI0037F59C4C
MSTGPDLRCGSFRKPSGRVRGASFGRRLPGGAGTDDVLGRHRCPTPSASVGAPLRRAGGFARGRFVEPEVFGLRRIPRRGRALMCRANLPTYGLTITSYDFRHLDMGASTAAGKRTGVKVAAPYYAVPVHPGDLGTKGGLLTDAEARVLREDGSPIAGLYAAENVAAAVMGQTYPGPGATIGPAMGFGWIAAEHPAASVPTA